LVVTYFHSYAYREYYKTPPRQEDTYSFVKIFKKMLLGLRSMINPKHPHGDCTFSGEDLKQLTFGLISLLFALICFTFEELYIDLLKRTRIRKPDSDNFYDWKYFRGGRPPDKK